MKIFIEEPKPGGKQTACLLMLDIKEAKLLHEMIEAAAETHKMRPTWKKMLKTIEEQLSIY